MAVRIPGQQPTAGLEPFFLDGTGSWIPRARDTAAGQYANSSAGLRDIADRSVAPLAGPVADTSLIDGEHAYLQAVVNDQENRVGGNIGSVYNLLGDPLSPAFGGIDDAVNRASQGIGQVPGVPQPGPPPGLPEAPPPPGPPEQPQI